MPDLAACDRNLAEATLVNLGATGRRLVSDGLVAAATDHDDTFFNAAVPLDGSAEPGPLLTDVVDFFGATPFSVWARRGLGADLGDAAFAAGLATSDGPPLLTMASPDVPPPPPELEIAPYRESDRREAVTASALGNAMSPHLAEVFVPPGIADHPTAGIVLGRVDGAIVTTAQWIVTDEAVGIYAVSTVPEHRGKGFGAAITWAGIAAGLTRGATWSLLQASDMGLGVYERMGYRVVDRYRFITRPSRP